MDVQVSYSGKFDFVGLAIHEIGHAMGLVSGVAGDQALITSLFVNPVAKGLKFKTDLPL
jgi:hypothetical protein